MTTYLTAEEAARYLKYPTVHAFRCAVKREGIPHIRRGRRLFFTHAQLDDFMAVLAAQSRPKRLRRVS